MAQRGSTQSGRMTATQEAKQALRKQVLEVLAAMDATEGQRASLQVCERLTRQSEWARARSVLLFAPMAGELDVWPLARAALEGGKAVALPCFNRQSRCYGLRFVRDLEREVAAGYYGIREPVAECETANVNQLDLLIVPGVAFDKRGHRLGRGKGYYDRLLAGAPGFKCGTGFDQQLVDDVPVVAHDIRLDCIVTPTWWIRTSGELQE